MSGHVETKLCKHCNNQTPFLVHHTYSYLGSTWQLRVCTLCFMPTLERTVISFTDFQGLPHLSEPAILYPVDQTSLTDLPDVIEKEYKAALKVRNISLDACAVLARRTLEVICSYENARGNTLMEKINNLIKSDRIPPLFAEMAHLGRKIGNMGAHATENSVTEDDVKTLLEFLETILEYLYVVPAKVGAVKTRLNMTP